MTQWLAAEKYCEDQGTGVTPDDPLNPSSLGKRVAGEIEDEIPLNVRQAALFLGVSPQTVYLWVEQKQIPHLRVMGPNIRFLKSDLVPFRAMFKREVGIGKTE